MDHPSFRNLQDLKIVKKNKSRFASVLCMILTPDDCKFCGKMSATPQFWQSRLPAHYRSVRRGRGPGIGAALAIPISKSLYDIYLSSAPYNYLGRKQTLAWTLDNEPEWLFKTFLVLSFHFPPLCWQ